MDRCRVEVISQTPNPQQVMYAAMHQDYSENFVFDEKPQWPAEAAAGELIVKRLLAGERGHYGPLEHPQIVLNCGFFPHSVMQQARTHRVGISFDVQCLAGGTAVTFLHASGALRKIEIGKLYDLWSNGETAIRERTIQGRNGEAPGRYRRDCKQRLRKMRLRVLNEETGEFETSQIQSVMHSGTQPVYRVVLADGKTLDCTANHRLLTDQGWQHMGDALGLVTNDKHEVLARTKNCNVLCNGTVHQPEALYTHRAWLSEQAEKGLSAKQIAELCDCSPNTVYKFAKKHQVQLSSGRHKGLKKVVGEGFSVCKDCHEHIHHNHLEMSFAESFKPIAQPAQWQPKPKPRGRKLRAHPVAVVDVQYLGMQETYDLEVEGPWHNFVANGLVVHNSMRYTGARVVEIAEGKRDVEDIFYLRPVGDYRDRQGKRYHYSPEQRQRDLGWCIEAAKGYQADIEAGWSEEHARGKLPFDYRQHFVMSLNVRSFMHFLDLRSKKDAQLEIQRLCDLMWPHFQAWVPAVAGWYETNRLGKARLSP
ncbi:MAG: FAD-dependent thymidylate synthase [Synechococcales cyanobacterium RM1_1_8]|nr:FAD-dependent thymidylate synthase [Synechococcales cyanobacterium RM1_1_8]